MRQERKPRVDVQGIRTRLVTGLHEPKHGGAQKNRDQGNE